MQKITLNAHKRKIFGRKIKKLRQQGLLPANIYGKKIKSEALQVNIKNFLTVYKQAGETHLVDLEIEKSTPRKVLINNYQTHPVTDIPLHVDFRQVDLKEKVQVAIPVDLIGEAAGVTKGGVLVQVLKELEVEALPTDLPDKIELDIAKLEEIGQSLAVKDLKLDKEKVKVFANANQLVVKIEEPAKEEVEEKPVEAVAAEETTTQTAKEGEPVEATQEKPESAAEKKETLEKAKENKPDPQKK